MIVDRKTARKPRYASWALPLLNDPRDVEFVALMLQCSALAVVGVTLFFSGPRLVYLAPFYWLVLAAGYLDRFTLMLHCASHRALFRPKYRTLNRIVPWVLGPFFGQTPEAYFAHHVGMHHAEENLEVDLSSTMAFQRDRLSHWLRYWGRFLSIGFVELARYLKDRGRRRLLRRLVVGESMYWAAVAALLFFRPGATFVVFVVPLVTIRTLMMIGNWGQHAFVSAAAPDSAYGASATCINSRYNRRCFNDGYHIGHHLAPRCHWTEYPVEFERNLAEYGRQDAIVFEGLDFFLVWVFLMTGNWSRLARAFVRLPGAPARNDDDVIRFLKERVQRIPCSVG